MGLYFIINLFCWIVFFCYFWIYWIMCITYGFNIRIRKKACLCTKKKLLFIYNQKRSSKEAMETKNLLKIKSKELITEGK